MRKTCGCADRNCFSPIPKNANPVLYPEFFVQAIDRPCLTAADLHDASTVKCEWICSVCSDKFVKPLQQLKRNNNSVVICQPCGRKSAGRLTSERAEKFISRFPEESKEFIRNLTAPERTIEFLSSSSHDICEWKCSFCGDVWESSAETRKSGNRGVGCSPCRKKVIAAKYVSQHTSTNLIDTHPGIATQLKSLVDYPEIDVKTVSTFSNQVGLWECVCGSSFTRKINRVVSRKSILCRSCSCSGKTLFEFEVAELVAALLNIPVETHYKREGYTEVDLYLPLLDMAIQLDPYWSHYQRYDNDVRITKELGFGFARVIRVREKGLFPIGKDFVVESKLSYDWASVIANSLSDKSLYLSTEKIEAALTKANITWINIVKHINVKNSSVNEPWFNEFVKNLTHPGRKLEYTPKGSEDLCLWSCGRCSFEWESKISNRSVRNKQNCIACSKINNKII